MTLKEISAYSRRSNTPPDLEEHTALKLDGIVIENRMGKISLQMLPEIEMVVMLKIVDEPSYSNLAPKQRCHCLITVLSLSCHCLTTVSSDRYQNQHEVKER